MPPEMRIYLASLKAIGVGFAVIGVTLVLLAVGAPSRLLGGIWGSVVGRTLLAVFGAIMLAIGYLSAIRAQRWYARTEWVLERTQPVDVTVLLHREASSDSTHWEVEVTRAQGSERYPVLAPLWDAGRSISRPFAAKAFVDPMTGGAVAFKMEPGRLWVMPERRGRRRAAR
jgi:hypothetical protein